jgi:hypothetical protein
MAEAVVKISEVEGKYENLETLNLEACGQLTESVQRSRLFPVCFGNLKSWTKWTAARWQS